MYLIGQIEYGTLLVSGDQDLEILSAKSHHPNIWYESEKGFIIIRDSVSIIYQNMMQGQGTCDAKFKTVRGTTQDSEDLNIALSMYLSIDLCPSQTNGSSEKAIGFWVLNLNPR